MPRAVASEGFIVSAFRRDSPGCVSLVPPAGRPTNTQIVPDPALQKTNPPNVRNCRYGRNFIPHRYTDCVNFTSDDAQLAYTSIGQGPAVILLHPTPCDHRFWLRVVESLTGRYRVILPDLRGHGQSEAGTGPITMSRLGADVVRLLDVLGIQRALFGGCSIGGYTLYELWREAPARISALAFCCSRPQGDADGNRAKREEWITKIRQRGTGDFIDSMLESLIGPTARQRSPEKFAEAREMMQTVRPEAAIAIQQGLGMRPDS